MAGTSTRPYLYIALLVLMVLIISIGGIFKLFNEPHAERETYSQYVERCLNPDRDGLRELNCITAPSQFRHRSIPEG
ncbi:hypothetical protein OU800_22165 [Pseudomonas sp. GOM7]|uniref:hypothetical protein n=1 Tax=Pseudomonas sp. GOM7 TaxID=2998079 RepID=UPI00227C955E|nr:hypothetical protein [Pseudomonas sp. GOM7]WAJ37281.1 hypothetical protein OU800_22165 [Pseudomonas sp. GOM7]